MEVALCRRKVSSGTPASEEVPASMKAASSSEPASSEAEVSHLTSEMQVS
jgi:hypothetical protein